MSTKKFQLVRFFPTDSKNLFAHFIQKDLIAKWAPGCEFETVKLYTNIRLKDGTKFEFIPVSGGTRVCVVKDGFSTNVEATACEFGWLQKLGLLLSMIDEESSDEMRYA